MNTEQAMKKMYADLEMAMWEQVNRAIENGEMTDEFYKQLGEAMKLLPKVKNGHLNIARQVDEIGEKYSGK